VGKWHLGWDWPIPPELERFFPGKDRKIDIGATATADYREAWRTVFSQPVEGGPTELGFEEYFGVDLPNWPPFAFIEDDSVQGIPTTFLDPAYLVKLQASQQGPALEGWTLEPVLPAITDRAVDFIEREALREEPFLLYYSMTSPHTPLSVNEPWKGASGLNLYADFVMETDAPVQLYHLESDLGETVNLALAEPERVQEMRGMLERLIRLGRSTSGAPQENDVEVIVPDPLASREVD